MFLWFILCGFDELKEAEHMFQSCLKIKPYERVMASLIPK